MFFFFPKRGRFLFSTRKKKEKIDFFWVKNAIYFSPKMIFMSNGPKTKSFEKIIFCLFFRVLYPKKSFLLWREQLPPPTPRPAHRYNQITYLAVSCPFAFSACFSVSVPPPPLSPRLCLFPDGLRQSSMLQTSLCKHVAWNSWYSMSPLPGPLTCTLGVWHLLLPLDCPVMLEGVSSNDHHLPNEDEDTKIPREVLHWSS